MGSARNAKSAGGSRHGGSPHVTIAENNGERRSNMRADYVGARARAYARRRCQFMFLVARAGQTECLNILLQRCPDIEVDARNTLGFTPLMKAALQGRTKCAKILLFAGESERAQV